MMDARASLRGATQARSPSSRLASLVDFDGDEAAFRAAWLEALGECFGARRVLLLQLAADRPWQALAQWPADAADAPDDGRRAFDLATQALDGEAVCQTTPTRALAATLDAESTEGGPAVWALVILTAETRSADPAETRQSLALLKLAVALPRLRSPLGSIGTDSSAALTPTAARSTIDPAQAVERLYDVLRTSIQLAAEPRFLKAVFGLCNQLAVRFACERVCLGWVDGAYVRLVAVSHVEKFDPRANAARDLETAMEEAASQGAEVCWPVPADQPVVSRAHEAYARAQGCSDLLSIPLRVDGETCAVLTLERNAGALDEAERFELRLIAEASARSLRTLRQTDRWLGARIFARLKRLRDDLLGPSYTAWKLAGIGLVGVAAVLAVLPWPYRIEAPIALRSTDVLFVPAPFDGYLRDVRVDVGDTAQADSVLLDLDTRELVLEESMAVADELRYAREAEKAQAARQFADMQIALARRQQAAAKLALIRHQIGSAQVRAPFAGVVVEGDLRKNLGAPVRKGDLLLKLAHTANLYLELEVDQVDVHELRPGMTGAFAFVGRPDQRFPMTVDRIDPAATMREGRNVYLVRARIEAPAEGWWRPGMGGAARLDAGERTVIWIMTHRTVRFLRQVFWL
jgi:hypothetical protein